METVPVGLLFPFLKSIPAKPTWMVSINAVEAGGSRSGLFPSPPPPSPRATAARGAAGAALRTCRELAALTQPRSGCPPPPGLSFLVSSSGSLISLSTLFIPLPMARWQLTCVPRSPWEPSRGAHAPGQQPRAHLCIAEGPDGGCVCVVEGEAGYPETSASSKGHVEVWGRRRPGDLDTAPSGRQYN